MVLSIFEAFQSIFEVQIDQMRHCFRKAVDHHHVIVFVEHGTAVAAADVDQFFREEIERRDECRLIEGVSVRAHAEEVPKVVLVVILEDDFPCRCV